MNHMLISVLAVVLIACSDGSNESSLDLVSFKDAPGPLNVGQRTNVVMRDAARSRDVTATFWYPANGENHEFTGAEEGAALISGDAKFPLVVLVHGIEDSAPATWPYLAPHLASHGYVVAAPSTGSTVGSTGDLVNHPGDVSFLIDAVFGENDTEGMFLNRIDENKVAVGGFSFGGAATYLLAYDPLYNDTRIDAVILMAALGSESPPINPAISLLTLYGTEDILISYNSGLAIYEGASRPKYLVTLEGGGHVGFTSSNDVNIGATMEQERQQALVRLSVFAYLTSVFNREEKNRIAAEDFLKNGLEQTSNDVLVYAELE